MEAFYEAAAKLSPSDIAIDCGANVGIYTCAMAESGAKVFAFEPNPSAYAALLENTRSFPNVVTVKAAVTCEDGPVRLYLHQRAREDPLKWSTGSSLVEGKDNVSSEAFEEVDGVDLSRFVKDLKENVRLMKIDIEGAEVRVLNALLDEGLQERIDEAFIELHDRQIPGLAESTRALRARLEQMDISHFRLDWH